MTSSQPKTEKETLRRRIAAELDRVETLVNRGTRWKDIATELADHGIADEGGAPLPPLTLRNHVDYIRRNPETYSGGAERSAADSLYGDEDEDGPVMAPVAATRASTSRSGQSGGEAEPSPAHYRSTLAEMRRTLEDLNQPGDTMVADAPARPQPTRSGPSAPAAAPDRESDPMSYGRATTTSYAEPTRGTEPKRSAEPKRGAEPARSPAQAHPVGRSAYGYEEPPARSHRAPVQAEPQAPRPQPSKPTVSAPTPMPQGGRQAAQGKPQMSANLVVCNDRGGLGKTLLANFLMTTVSELELKARLIEYDVNSRLEGHFIPERLEWRRISQDFLEVMNQGGDALFNYWDPLAPELQEGGLIIDFGANVSNAFFDWADLSGVDYYLGQGEALTFFVPVTADMAAARTGIGTLHRIHAIFPRARRVLVENEYSGRFTDFQDPEYDQQKAVLIANQEIDVITMPACRAQSVWPRVAAQRLARLARVDRNALVEMGIDPLKASRSLPLISGWITDFIERLKPIVHQSFGRR